MMITDEGHVMKNDENQLHWMIRRHEAPINCINWILSATPMMNARDSRDITHLRTGNLLQCTGVDYRSPRGWLRTWEISRILTLAMFRSVLVTITGAQDGGQVFERTQTQSSCTGAEYVSLRCLL